MKVFPALQATFSFTFHSLLGSVGGLSRDKLLLSRPSLQSFLWNLLKSSRHVTSRNQGLSPRRTREEKERGPGNEVAKFLSKRHATVPKTNGLGRLTYLVPLQFRILPFQIGHFRVPKTLTLKKRPSAKPFL